MISIDTFKEKQKELMKHHWIESSTLLTPDKKRASTTGMFELFSKLSRITVMDLKEKLIDWICDKQMVMTNLNQSKQSFAEWLHCITLNDDFMPSELTIYCL